MSKKRLFSKALFKQSCKANGIMWIIITVAVCFMLSCVMLISGTSNISAVKDGVQDTIIEELLKSEIKKSSVNLHETTKDSEEIFDITFTNKFNEINTKENFIKFALKENEAKNNGTNLVKNYVEEKITNDVTNALTLEVENKVKDEALQIEQEIKEAVIADMQTNEALEKIQAKMQEGKTLDEAKALVALEYTNLETNKITNEHVLAAKALLLSDEHKTEVTNRIKNEKLDLYTNEAKELYKNELKELEESVENEFKKIYIVPCYEAAINAVMAKYPEQTNKAAYGAALIAINPNNQAAFKYEENNEEIPEEYINEFIPYIKADIESNLTSNVSTTLNDYINSDARYDFRIKRATNGVSILVGSQLQDKEYKKAILDTLANYRVTEEKYNTMGFDYKNVKKVSYEACEEYQNKYDYELSILDDEIKNNQEKYEQEKNRIHDEVYLSVAGSLLDKLPENVSNGIEELGTMDLYGLIVGSIFFKMAGLLLPIIYVIMCSNNLIASQVDTGSMAYVLSTSTRRKEVTFTQGIFLISSIFLMFVCTTITSCICFKIANVTTDLTYLKLILINLGAFVTLFAISGINFFTSSIFDRSKKAMALGGGISMFFLVATMLGLFGSPVIPSVVRITALNNFNYVSLITLFDVVSILNGEYMWIWKLAILAVIGLTGYITGSIYFRKKDLPL